MRRTTVVVERSAVAGGECGVPVLRPGPSIGGGRMGGVAIRRHERCSEATLRGRGRQAQATRPCPQYRPDRSGYPPSQRACEASRSEYQQMVQLTFLLARPHCRAGKSKGWPVQNCAPDCALTGVYPRQTSSLTRKHRETSCGSQVVEVIGERALRYVSPSLEQLAFQAGSFIRLRSRLSSAGVAT